LLAPTRRARLRSNCRDRWGEWQPPRRHQGKRSGSIERVDAPWHAQLCDVPNTVQQERSVFGNIEIDHSDSGRICRGNERRKCGVDTPYHCERSKPRCTTRA
jgi:hypothetical protein